MRIDRVGLLIEEFLDSDDDDDGNELISYPGPLRLQHARMAGTNAKSIIDLPEDIIFEILEYFDLNMYMEEHWVRGMPGICAKRDSQIDTLLSLSLVCKSFSRLAQPLLYKYPRELQVPSVRRQFTRTVASRPDLAARVRYVVYEVHREDFEGTRESRPGTESRQLYKHLVPQITIGDKRAFLTALYGGDIDAEYAFLFYLLPAMSTLRFSLPCILARTISWTMDLLEYSLKSHRKTGSRGPFCSLRTLFLGWNSEGSSSSRIVISPGIVQNFASLPLLSDVSFLRPLDSSASIDQPWDKFRSPIKSLHFLEATLPIDFLTGLFSICHDLKRFSFNWSTEGTVGSLFGSLYRFMQVICYCVPALGSLELSVMDTAAVWDSQSIGPEEKGPIGQYLKEFRNLKHLKIAGFFLTGIPRSGHDADNIHPLSLGVPGWLDTNGLPISLDELVIDCEGRSKGMADGYDCDLTYILPFLERLANICIDGRLPNFKRLQLRGKYTPVYRTFEHVEALFAQAGVVVTLRGFPGEGCMPTSSAFDRVGRTWSGLLKRDVWRGVGRRDQWGSGSRLFKPSAAKSILDLPTEILKEILSYLDPTGFIATRFQDAREVGTFKHAVTWRLGALADCCRVSKRFCEVSRPMLYKVFCDYGKLSRRLRFINTLATYPNLAGYVKELHLGYHDSQTWYYKLEEPRGITATFDDLMREARTIEMGDRKDQWLQALQLQTSPLDDVDLPVLLSLVPSLEVLSFGAHDKGDSLRFHWAFSFMILTVLKLRRGELDANPWEKLRKFAFRLSYRDRYVEDAGALIILITKMLFFSNLRSLQLTGGEGPLAEDDDLNIVAQPFDNIESVPNASPIDTLHLEAGKMDVFTICIPIDAARALKSFTLSYTAPYAAMGMLAGASLIVDRLCDHHASTLEHLALVPNERERVYGTDPYGNAPPAPLRAAQLRSFTALRHLELSACFLPRVVDSSGNAPLPVGESSDIIFALPPPPPPPPSPSQLRTAPFPPSLERLTIDGYGLEIDALEDWLWALVERREHGALASLRVIELTRMMPDGLTEEEFLPLGEFWTQVGVAFTVNGLWDAGMFFAEIADMPEGALDNDEPLESESEGEYKDDYEDEDWYGKGDFGDHKELDGADEDDEDEDEEEWNENTDE